MYQPNLDNSHHQVIDLRSDTVTKPSPGMRSAMAGAEVGDDVYGEDPTVLALEQRVAELCKKEAGLFLPSGTQSNLVALLTHCGRGEEVLVGDTYHSYTFESGGASALGGIVLWPLATDDNGGLTPDQVKAAIKPDHTWFAKTKLLALENTVWGQVQSVELIHELSATAHAQNLSVHLDGARVWHAAVALGVPVAEITKSVDSVSTCLSKGLGAPAGSVLCGSKPFIRQAQRARKVLGGGMRQVGVLAACGLYALDHNLPRLNQDHAKASKLAAGLRDIPNLKVHSGDTNMIFLEPTENDRQALVQSLASAGILVGPPEQKIRVVAHLDIATDDISHVVEQIRDFYRQAP